MPAQPGPRPVLDVVGRVRLPTLPGPRPLGRTSTRPTERRAPTGRLGSRDPGRAARRRDMHRPGPDRGPWRPSPDRYRDRSGPPGGRPRPPYGAPGAGPYTRRRRPRAGPSVRAAPVRPTPSRTADGPRRATPVLRRAAAVTGPPVAGRPVGAAGLAAPGPAGPRPARSRGRARGRPSPGRGGLRRRPAGASPAGRPAASRSPREAGAPRHAPADPDRRARGGLPDRAGRLRRPPGRGPGRRAARLRDHRRDPRTAAERGEAPFVLVLDSLEDPQNVGTLLRSAEAARVHGVLFPTRRQAPLTPAAVKASAGAVEHLLLAPVDDLAAALADLHGRGLRVAGSEADAPLTARQADLRGPLVIVVGSEGQGLGPAVRRRCDLLMRIPMRGFVGSLNAAVAGSILLFEAVAQRDPEGRAQPATPTPWPTPKRVPDRRARLEAGPDSSVPTRTRRRPKPQPPRPRPPARRQPRSRRNRRRRRPRPHRDAERPPPTPTHRHRPSSQRPPRRPRLARRQRHRPIPRSPSPRPNPPAPDSSDAICCPASHLPTGPNAEPEAEGLTRRWPRLTHHAGRPYHLPAPDRVICGMALPVAPT